MQAYSRGFDDHRPSSYGHGMPSSSYGTQNPLYDERSSSYYPEPNQWNSSYNSMPRPSYDDRRPSGRYDRSQSNSTRNYSDYGRGSSRMDDDQHSLASRPQQMGYSQYNGHGDPRNSYMEFDTNDYRPMSDDGRSTYSREDSRITFTLDHLATFTATQKQSLPSQSLNKLKKMESGTSVSAQRMLMKLDKHHVLICKPSNGNVMEKFPLNLIEKPEAFLARDPDEPHNNILVFTVLGVKKLKSPTEMHIFRCLAVSGQEIADELLRLKAGRPLKGDNYRLAPIPPPPDVMAMNNNDSKLVNLPRRDSSINENVSIDVYTLNHCFDDIEKFIAKMHQITAAYKELKQRHQGRNSRTFTHGDGILALRSAPPPGEDFVDIFRKYKLTFNLLGKLKGELRDPNAAELVHFIFTPLALIVQASIDSSGGENIAGSIITPLMTELAVDLLSNCLSSKESVMWQSLGEAWTVPRYGRSPSIIPYNPIFYDGWSPGYDYADMDPTADLSRRSSVAEPERTSPRPTANEAEAQYSSIYPKKDRPTYQHNYTYDTAVTREETEVKQPSPVPITSRDRKICEVTADRVGKNEKELTLIAGELIEILDDRKNWWKARNSSGDEGYVPCTILKPSSETELFRPWDPPLPAPKSPPAETYKPTSPPVVRAPTSPPVSHKSTSTLVNYKNYKTTATNTSPQLKPRSPSPPPAPVVIPIVEPPQSKPLVLKNPVARKHSIGTNTTEEDLPVFKSRLKPVTPPPPPPPAYTTPMIEQYQQYSEPEPQHPPVLKKSKSQHDLLQDEINEKINKGKLNIKRTAPNAYFTARSTPEEVAEWLRAKEFSDDTQYQLRKCNGATLMTMDYSILERHFGRDEGKRLASQIELQKKISGFKTMSSRELEALLQIRLQEIGDADEP